jgi:tRNA (Thr-GGU) A37 N-methylase
VPAFEIPQIATVVGGHTTVHDDYQGGVDAIIRLDPEYPAETLQGLEAFSHVEVVWKMTHARPEDIELHARSPRNNPNWPATGTFAHRNHRRPDQIGISRPRLLRVDGRDIHVTDLDAVDGTPVLALLPWFEEMGPRGPVHEPAWVKEMLPNYWADSSARP